MKLRTISGILSAMLLAGCSTTPTHLAAGGIDASVPLHRDAVTVAKCTQWELQTKNPGASALASGVGYRVTMMESDGRAIVWAPSTGYPIFSAQFENGEARIATQDMIWPMPSAEVTSTVVEIIEQCDKETLQ